MYFTRFKENVARYAVQLLYQVLRAAAAMRNKNEGTSVFATVDR